MPKPKKRLDVIATRAMEWQARWAGGLTYERFVVDLLAGMCSCRFWRLCGKLCLHAWDNLEDYCSNFYSPAAYAATYGKLVSPINGENMWPKVECDTIHAPIFRVKPERPRMVRIREPDENRSQIKLRRMGTSVTCNNCGQYGHNRRHCPNPIVSGRSRGRGRGRGRERGRAASSQSLSITPATASSQLLRTTPTVAASTQPPPIVATSASQDPTIATDAMNSEPLIVAPFGSSQQALPLEGSASQPLLPVTTTSLQQPPRASSQPLPKTKAQYAKAHAQGMELLPFDEDLIWEEVCGGQKKNQVYQKGAIFSSSIKFGTTSTNSIHNLNEKLFQPVTQQTDERIIYYKKVRASSIFTVIPLPPLPPLPSISSDEDYDDDGDEDDTEDYS
ncbi:hypothetical protein Ahy_A09g045025 [Arachis hypogaea]|uniref:CCHC-type domain-containing protein n=1 Tax=Arachis hypogaea TaxID=3818 RepID=A0A445BLC6_ARAHY|nr:hypothetical protein Ahy_A09g045025 [Arachis hypogaea]